MDFPIELWYNTIIHLLFHYFLSLGSLRTSLFGFFVIAYSFTPIRMTAVLEYLRSAFHLPGHVTIFIYSL